MNVLKRLYSYLIPYKKRFIYAIISMVIHAALTVFFVRVFQELLETIIADISADDGGIFILSMISLGMIILYLAKDVVYYAQKYLSKYVSHKIMRDIRNDLYNHLQKLPLSFYNKSKTGEILSRLTNDVKVLEGAIVDSSVNLVYNSLTVIGGFIYLFYLNYRLTLFLMVVMPLVAYIVVKFNRKIRNKSKEVQIKIADVSDIIQETLSAIRVVKSFGREDYEYERFQEENQANFRATVKNSQYKAALSPLVEFSSALGFTAVLWFGGREVMHGTMGPAELIAFFTMIITIGSPLQSVTKVNSTIQSAMAAAERIFETLDYDVEIITKKNHIKLDKINGRVEFNNLYFAYDEETVLNDINLIAEPGESVALVGPSGAGKSTLVDMIPRFYDPIQGEVLVDGHDIRDLDVDFLREHIGVVPQETILFSGTIRDNIKYGDLDASESEIIAAAKASNSHEFIIEFPEGYDTYLGERGIGLSGGQKQRIAIARALLKNPSILIFDEATSSLDTASERLVQEALDRLKENRTTFIIAHRLSTVINSDKIVVLEEGNIIEQGTHQQLIDQEGLYYKLYQHQLAK
ncbi:MAG: ABC transporter ATP-binding protein [Bacillota bacterium]